jgi:hypothetical protein
VKLEIFVTLSNSLSASLQRQQNKLERLYLESFFRLL